jgi:hypothetical protein
LSDATPDSRDRLVFKWTSSAAVDQSDVGDPLTSSTYSVWLYDGMRAVPS